MHISRFQLTQLVKSLIIKYNILGSISTYIKNQNTIIFLLEVEIIL